MYGFKVVEKSFNNYIKMEEMVPIRIYQWLKNGLYALT